MLFNTELPTKLSNVKKSSFDLKKGDDPVLVMQTAIGQGDTLVTPLHSAMIISAVANDGVMMEPVLLDSLQDFTGRTVREYKSKPYDTVISKKNARPIFIFSEKTAPRMWGQ